MNEPRAYFYNEDHARLATSSNLKSTKTYISGPLPHSSILHLSLNHLLAGRPTLEANSNAIVTNRRVLILSPDRASFSTALAQENDTNLKLLERELQNLLANVEIKWVVMSLMKSREINEIVQISYYLNSITILSQYHLYTLFPIFSSSIRCL